MDDWVPLLAVEGSARLLGATTDVEAREAALAVLAELATAGLIQIGEVSDGGFFEWEASTDDALARARSIRETTDRNHWGFAVWLCNTPAGDAEGEVFLAESP